MEETLQVEISKSPQNPDGSTSEVEKYWPDMMKATEDKSKIPNRDEYSSEEQDGDQDLADGAIDYPTFATKGVIPDLEESDEHENPKIREIFHVDWKLYTLMLRASKALFESPTSSGDRVVRIPTIVALITSGGRLAGEDKIALGKFVTQNIANRHRGKVNITVTEFDGEKAENKSISIIKYGIDDVNDLWRLCVEWLKTNYNKVAY